MRYHAAPYLAASATCASVSTFWTSVGRPPTPRWKTRGGVERGSPGPPSSRSTTADSSPARKRSAAVTTRTGTRSPLRTDTAARTERRSAASGCR